jgi:hypothetical protein
MLVCFLCRGLWQKRRDAIKAEGQTPVAKQTDCAFPCFPMFPRLPKKAASGEAKKFKSAKKAPRLFGTVIISHFRLSTENQKKYT